MKIENIKFKAKSILDRAWVIGDLIHKEDGKIAILRNGFNVSEVDPSTVCQFTGLTDCKGNELFEHDLIHFLGFWHTAEMIWSEDNYSFMAVCENKHFYFLRDILRVSKFEIIGNKFDKEK